MKSGTFRDSPVIYFLNRGVLMRAFTTFAWYYAPRCIARITEGEPKCDAYEYASISSSEYKTFDIFVFDQCNQLH